MCDVAAYKDAETHTLFIMNIMKRQSSFLAAF